MLLEELVDTLYKIVNEDRPENKRKIGKKEIRLIYKEFIKLIQEDFKKAHYNAKYCRDKEHIVKVPLMGKFNVVISSGYKKKTIYGNIVKVKDNVKIYFRPSKIIKSEINKDTNEEE